MLDYTKLLEKLSPQPDAEDILRLRVGTVLAVNADGTLNLTVSEITVEDVPKLSGTSAPVGAVVQVITYRGSMLVIGAVAQTSTDSVSSRVATTPRTSNSAAVTSETLIDSVTASLVSGRTYKVRWEAKLNSTVASDTAFFRIRENNLAGAQLQNTRVLMGPTGTGYPAAVEAEYTAVATGDKTFVGTLARASGTGDVSVPASSSTPVYLYVDYIRG